MPQQADQPAPDRQPFPAALAERLPRGNRLAEALPLRVDRGQLLGPNQPREFVDEHSPRRRRERRLAAGGNGERLEAIEEGARG